VSDESILAATLANDVAAVRNRLAAGDDPNTRDDHGWTPLMYAAMRGQTEVARVLVEGGADVNVRAADGSGAVLKAALWRHDETAAFLRDRGADLDAADASGWTARQVLEQRRQQSAFKEEEV
jgi:ankyrin repeat protein